MNSKTMGAWLVALASCHHYVTPDRGLASAHPEPPSGSFWVIADTQFNNFAGDRESAERDDAVENVAIRPPSLDLWSELVLASVLSKVREDPLPTLFLGDGANTSCVGEYQRFLDAMGNGPWFAAIGNHDGFYMGNLGFGGENNEWTAACKRDVALPMALTRRLHQWDPILVHGAGTMPKATSVLLYLNNLYERHVITVDPLCMCNWSPAISIYGEPGYLLDVRGDYKIADGTRAVTVTAFVATYDIESNQYLAFVLQDIELANHDHAMLVDTSDYLRRPPDGYKRPWIVSKLTGINNLPGELGMISNTQRTYLERNVRALGNSRRFFLAGHHDWQSLSIPGARNLREAAFIDPRFATYISGHTHDPTATGGFNGKHQWELNVASVTDWPMQYVRVSYWPMSDGDDPATDFRVTLHTIPQEVGGTCELSKTGANDKVARARELDYGGAKYVARALADYDFVLTALQAPARSAEQTAVARACDTTCVQGYRTRIANELRFGTDDRRKLLLRELASLDQRALRLSPWVAAQELSCAIWASQIEQAYWSGTWVGKLIRDIKRPKTKKKPIRGGRRLDPGDTTFRVKHADLPTYPGATE